MNYFPSHIKMKNMADKGEGDLNLSNQNQMINDEEAPSDTQINNVQNIRVSNKVNQSNQGKIIQQNEKLRKKQGVQGNQKIQKTRYVQQVQKGQNVVYKQEIQENQVIQNNEEVREPIILEEQIIESDQEMPKDQQYQMLQGGIAKLKQNQFIQDGELYQVNENGQLYKVIQEIGNGGGEGEEMQYGKYEYQKSQVLTPKIAQPIYQNIQQNEPYQQNQLCQPYQTYLKYLPFKQYPEFQQYQNSQENQVNNSYESYFGNVQYSGEYQNSYNQSGNTKEIGKKQKKKKNTSPKDKILTEEEKKIVRKSKRLRKFEPSDSCSKLRIVSSKSNLMPNQSSKLYMNINNNGYNNYKDFNNNMYNSYKDFNNYSMYNSYKDFNNYNMYNSFKNFNNNNRYHSYKDFNNNRMHILNSNKSSLKSKSKLSLAESSGYIDIPRIDYNIYGTRQTIQLNDGMDTGEYKFVGEKTIYKEVEEPIIRNMNVNKELIKKEIRKRNNTTLSFEVTDKFYALTELNKDKNSEKSNPDNNNIHKNEFYSSLKYSDYNNSVNNTSNSKVNTINTSINNVQINNSSISSKKKTSSNKKTHNNYNKNYSAANLISKNYGIMSLKERIYGTNNYSSSDFFKDKNRKSRNLKKNYESSLKTCETNKGHMTRLGSGIYTNSFTEFRTELPLNNNINNMGSNINYSNFENKNSISAMPADNYSKYLLEQINRIRKDPKSFIGVIENAKNYVIKDRFGRLIFNGKIKIALANGIAEFNEAIHFLRNTEPMEPLKYISYLTVLPPQNEREIKDKEDLSDKVLEMVNGGINIKSYWRDIIKDPEISFLLMIIDDNGVRSGKRRKDILNPRMKYIGISSAEIKKDFVCYITLS